MMDSKTKLFDKLSNDSRLWVIPIERELTESESRVLLENLEKFVSSWTAHQQPVTGEVEILYNRFIVICADVTEVAVSGCAIDKMMAEVNSSLGQIGVKSAGHENVFFRESGNIKMLDRKEFKCLVNSGKITTESIVFDNTVSNLEAFRSGRWELPFINSWHSQAFKTAA
jgi:hypothetical protein